MSPNKKQHPVQRPECFQKRCYASGGTIRVCCTMNLLLQGVMHHCWHLSITEISCRCNPRKNYQRFYMKWCYSTIMPTCTLTWQKTLYRIWIGKIFHTHLIHLMLCPQIFTCSLSNNLQGTSFPDENVLQTWLNDSKPRDLYRRRIEKLLQWWHTVVFVSGMWLVVHCNNAWL